MVLLDERFDGVSLPFGNPFGQFFVGQRCFPYSTWVDRLPITKPPRFGSNTFSFHDRVFLSRAIEPRWPRHSLTAMIFALPLADVFPFHLRWSLDLPDQIESADVYGDYVYYGSFHEFGVARLSTGKLVWRHPLAKNEFAAPCTAGEGKLFVAAGKGPTYAYDLKTGKLLWKRPKSGYSSAPAYYNGLVFVQTKSNTISALDPKNGQPRWSYVFPGAQPDTELNFGPFYSSGNVLFLDQKGVVSGLKASTGKPAWPAITSSERIERLCVVGNTAYVFDGTNASAYDVISGKRRWISHTRGAPATQVTTANGLVVFQTRLGIVQALDANTGKEKWNKTFRDPRHGGEMFAGWTSTPTGFFSIIDGKGHLLDFDGEEKWAALAPVEQFDRSGTWLGNQMLVFDSHSIHALAPGAAVVAKDNGPRIQSLIGRIEKLSRPETRELLGYGEPALKILLSDISVTLDAYLAETRNKKSTEKSFSRLYDLCQITTEAMLPGATSTALPIAAKSIGTEAESTVMAILLKADDRQTLPLLLQVLVKKSRQEDGRGVALQVVLESRDPRAVRWKLAQMRDPQVDEETAFAVYPTLVDTCGTEGIELARHFMPTNKTLPPLVERLKLDSLGKQQIATGKDSSGTEWVLFNSSLLGSYGDLWIAQKAGGKWVKPIFTGLNTAPVSGFVSKKRDIPKDDPKIKALIAGGWLKTLVNAPGLRKNQDGDGLTDLEEARLGTDPKRTDTDGDGLPDDRDANPVAPDRRLNDPELLIRRALESRYLFDNNFRPGLLSMPAGIRPFEFLGRGGPIIWNLGPEGKWAHPLEKQYEHGVALIRLSERDDARELPKNVPVTDRYIEWNADRSEGTVTISNYYGGLNGTGYKVTMRKISGDWLPVKMVMAWIS